MNVIVYNVCAINLHNHYIAESVYKNEMKVIKIQSSIQCEDAIRCIFDLNDLDIKVFKILQNIGSGRADGIADIIKKERSTVYRSLQKLTKCGICDKKRKTLPEGGYYHVYELKTPNTVKKYAEDCLDTWYEKMKKTLQYFDAN